MAVAELIVSRRALLGAACAAALPRTLSDHPEQASSEVETRVEGPLPPSDAWHKALARYRAAEAALAAAAHIEDEDRYDRLGARHDAALKRLLRTPAPNLSAVATKLDLTIDHQAWELTGGEACTAALKADAGRLCRRT